MLTSLPRVKSYAAVTDDRSDVILTTLIAAVSARILTRLRRPALGLTAVKAETHDHGGVTDRLQLREYPVATTAPIDVRIDGVALARADFTLEDPAAAFLMYQPGGVHPQDWPRGRQHIAVDYTFGYADIPEDIREAATTQVVWQFNRTGHRGSRLGSRSTESGEGATATYMVDPWAPEVTDALEPYRRRLI
jgi:hypothetical protein